MKPYIYRAQGHKRWTLQLPNPGSTLHWLRDFRSFENALRYLRKNQPALTVLTNDGIIKREWRLGQGRAR